MRGLAIVGALLGAVGAVPASATVFTYVITGTVDAASSNDGQGYFGALDDAAFTATFTVDDANPQSVYQFGSSSLSAWGGGQLIAGTLPPVDGGLAIGGTTVLIPRGNFHQEPAVDPVYGDITGDRIDAADLGAIAKDRAAGTLVLDARYSYSYGQYLGGVFNYGTETMRSLSFLLRSADFTDPDYRQPGIFALAPGSVGAFAAAYAYGTQEGTEIYSSSVTLLPTQLTVSGAVPEPAAWLMLVAGFGAVGFMLRAGAARRRPGSAPERG